MDGFTRNISTNGEGSANEHSPCLRYTGKSAESGEGQGQKIAPGQVQRRGSKESNSGGHFREPGKKNREDRHRGSISYHQGSQDGKQDDITAQPRDRLECMHDGSVNHMAERLPE